jgi:hypothetical protein
MTADMAIEQAQRADSASFESLDKNAPSKAGTKHLERFPLRRIHLHILRE